MTVFEHLSAKPYYQMLFRTCLHRRFATNEVIIEQGHVPTKLFLLLSGLATVRFLTEDGRELLLSHFHPSDFFGEMGLFDANAERTAMVIASDDCIVAEVDYRRFHEIACDHPILWTEIAGQLSKRLRGVNRQLAELPSRFGSERIWAALRELALRQRSAAVKDKNYVELNISRIDLGKLAQCSRELAGIALRDLARKGSIRLAGRKILVPIDKQLGERASTTSERNADRFAARG